MSRTVVLVIADTWRGDHAFTEKVGQPLTPHLTSFAQTAEVFRDANSVSNSTSPGTAGILTGLYPNRSTVDRNMSKLPAKIPTLASLLAEHGFKTGAVVANPVLRPGMGFEQGFDHYELIQRTRPVETKVRGRRVVEAALSWLDGL